MTRKITRGDKRLERFDHKRNHLCFKIPSEDKGSREISCSIKERVGGIAHAI